jgi:XTP/dITP diphosphohydrolase
MEAVTAVLCSRNAHKLEELRAALPGWELKPLAAVDYPDETGSSYYENALAKARFGRAQDDAGAWMLGEDSGIEVAALDGGPGINSARWSKRWIEELLERLTDAPDRAGRYVCEVVALGPGGEELRGTGILEGTIALAPRGREGFGYDPIFIPAGEDRSVAELGNAWKRTNSHRARAAAALRAAVLTK